VRYDVNQAPAETWLGFFRFYLLQSWLTYWTHVPSDNSPVPGQLLSFLWCCTWLRRSRGVVVSTWKVWRCGVWDLRRAGLAASSTPGREGSIQPILASGGLWLLKGEWDAVDPSSSPRRGLGSRSAGGVLILCLRQGSTSGMSLYAAITEPCCQESLAKSALVWCMAGRRSIL